MSPNPGSATPTVDGAPEESPDGIELRDGTRIQVRPVEGSDAEAAFVIADAWQQQCSRLLEVCQTLAILVRCDFTARHPIGQDRTGVLKAGSRLMSGPSCDEPHDERDDGDHDEPSGGGRRVSSCNDSSSWVITK